MFNLILFGPPGSGKGTQSEKLVQKYGFVHLSTGNLLRQEISEKTPLGLQAKNFMDKGQLVPDAVVIGMIDHCIEKNIESKGFLFDGFPRTVAQAEALDKLLAYRKTAIHSVVALDVNEEELVKRLLKRGETSSRSDDTDETVIRNRFSVYNNETQPVAEHYKKLGRFELVPGVGSIDEIFASISQVIEKQMATADSISAQ